MLPNLALETIEPRFKSPDRLVAQPLAQCYRAWRELAGARFAPSREEIAPARMKSVLRDVFVIEVIEDGADFRLTLAGERIARFLGPRLKPGTLFSTIAGSLFHERAFRTFRHCVETKEPIALGPQRTTLIGREFLALEVLVQPLSDDGETVTGLLGAVHLSPLGTAALTADQAASMPAAFSG
jgi:hypothetical protein